ncbi:GNAT family N-acetyltransferase [Marivibrio halodurans]|uniref:GNAT family N-acetyltransferase n=1 Tax=Marivibrio halodurans TaxID=2039722 RepID=A0A8J7V3F8_9PROT|nr:GNAT family N-acetyltransferase [Marivibrio halodurans]MBP5856789.1 GNAT family N-acetyltransferase [Marivibrio halodurans]
MTEISLDWDRPTAMGQEGWQALLAHCPRANAFQSWSWGAATAVTHGHRNRRAVILADGRPIGLLQLSERRWLGALTFAQLIRGPLFISGAATAIATPFVLRALRRMYRPSRGRVLALTPELDDGPLADRYLREAGFIHVKTGYSSAWLDIAPNARLLRRGLRGNFRNQLSRAEEAPLTIEEGDDAVRDWLIARHAEHRHGGRYGGPAPALLRAVPLEEMRVLIARAEGMDTPVAGTLFLRHGASATYEVGWTSEAGRAHHAHNLLLWRGILMLKRDGIRRLDLGGLDEVEAGGAAHFKHGLGGEPFTLAGTYV